jgi:hypothetical protein
VAFAQVFGLPLKDLMAVPDEKRESFRALIDLLAGMNELKADAEIMAERVEGGVQAFRNLAREAAAALGYVEADGLKVPTDDVLYTLTGLAEALVDLRDAIKANPLSVVAAAGQPTPSTGD